MHGVAGLALAAYAVALGSVLRASAARRSATVATVSGVIAAVLSLAQAASMALLVAQLDVGAAAATESWFDGINRVDSVKLVALGVFVAAVTLTGARAAILPRWLAWAGAMLAALLPIGGTAMLVDSHLLTSALYLSLPALLTWVVAITASTLRRIP